jgi:2-polyprenyl-3-methyl-5-hydroxy-6-metoxy-1,4-benzoquinol methylase
MKCLFCKIRRKFFFFTYDYNRNFSKKKYRYNKCLKCGTISLVNPPKVKSYYYQDNYHEISSKLNIWKNNINRIAYLKKLQLKKNSSLLDIGSGYGDFLYCSKKLGFKSEGLDIDKKLNDFTKKNYNIKTIIEKKFSKIKKKYDIIVAWHSIEHFPNAKKIIDFIIKRLKIGGHTIISMPNPSAFGFKLLKNKWVHIDAPRHKHLIEMKFLKKYFEFNKFKIILSTTNDDDAKYNNRLAYAVFISNIFSSYSFFQKKNLVKKIYHAMGNILRIFFFLFENSHSKGSAYTLILKKTQ